MHGQAACAFEREDFDVEVDGARLRVRRLRLQGGARGTIVFLHDSLGSIETWRDFPLRLCARSRCDGLIYDREGYGHSSARRLERDRRYLHVQARVLVELVEQCRGLGESIEGKSDEVTDRRMEEDPLRPAAPNTCPRGGGSDERADAAPPGGCVFLFGHSDGGTVALLGAALRPAWCAGVIAEGAHVYVEERTLAGLRDALPWWEDAGFRRRVERYHGDKAADVFGVWTRTWLSPAFRDWEIMGDLREVVCPVLVVQGERDEYATEQHARAIAEGVGGVGELLMVPGAGHTPHREDDRVLDASAAFMERWLSADRS
ncbi:MAG: alpha/beta hydrolase [Phycisphaerales bacterium]|nr:alpha/beta hydrolase [Phycisphaerales bacterium]